MPFSLWDMRPQPCFQLKLLCSQFGGLFGALFLVFLFKAVDATSGVDQLLFAGEERVAARTDFDADVAFVGGACFERVLTRTNNVHLIVGGVDSSFHLFTFREI